MLKARLAPPPITPADVVAAVLLSRALLHTPLPQANAETMCVILIEDIIAVSVCTLIPWLCHSLQPCVSPASPGVELKALLVGRWSMAR